MNQTYMKEKPILPLLLSMALPMIDLNDGPTLFIILLTAISLHGSVKKQ